MASEAQLNQLQSLYIAYFGRPADAAGVSYWTPIIDVGTSFDEIASRFMESDEFTATSSDLNDVVAAAYANGLGRDAGADEIAFWVDQIEAGKATVASLLEAFRSTDDTTDSQTLENKILVANAYTAAAVAGAEFDTAASVALLAGVDSTQASVDAALNELGQESGDTFTLTAGVDDTILGTSGDDTITGTSLEANDLIIDTSTTDNDVMNLTLTAVNGPARVEGIENINVDWDAFGTAEFVATNVKGATITGTSSKTGFLGNFTVTAAGANNVVAGDGMKGNLTVTGVTDSTVDVGAAKTATISGTAATTDSVVVNAGATTTDITTAIETVTLNAGAATNNITVTNYKTATIDAAEATSINLNDGNTATDSASVVIGADATVATGGNVAGSLTFDIADGKTVTVTGGIGAGLTVTGAGDATVKADDITTWEVANEKTDGTLTVESTATTTAQDVSDVNADLIRFSGAGAKTITAQSGANLEVTADLAAGVFAVADDTDADSINVTFTKSQGTSTTFDATNDFETVNIVAAAAQAASPTITDLTFKSLVNAGNTINLSGTNDVAITELTAKVLDASSLNGELEVITAAAATNVTVAGAQGKNNVTFDAASVEAAFVGQDAADTVNFGTLGQNAKATAVTGGGNDTVIANVGTMDNATGYLVVESGAGNNTVELAGTVASGVDANIVLTFGAGTDTLKLANGTNLVDANLTISGLDVINVNGDNATVAAATVTGQSYSVTGEKGFAGSTLTIELADGDDVVDLSNVVATDSANTGAKLVVESGDGDDTITLGASAEIVQVGAVDGAGIDVITGFDAASDVIKFTGTAAVNNLVDATAKDYDTGYATLAEALTAVAAAEGQAAEDDAIAFIYGGDTYVLLTADNTYANDADAVIQLVGVDVADLTVDNFLMA